MSARIDCFIYHYPELEQKLVPQVFAAYDIDYNLSLLEFPSF